MAVATHIQPIRRTLSASPIDWRMDIELHGDSDAGRSPDGFGSPNSTGRLRFGSNQPCDETVTSSTTGLLVRELLQQVNDLGVRVEYLENRLSSPHQAGPAFDTEVEPEPTHDEFDDLDEVAGAEPSLTGQEDGGPRLTDLPRGPLSIDVVAKAIGKTVRTLRGWCQIEKYEIPAHKEAGHWRFYRDELVTWHADYEAISRRDAKRAQAKRRKTKHGKKR
jgi:hypothetical protein